jgi:WD repeat and SOF domain-containing protein 1
MDITFSTSAESVTGVRFNPSEPSVLASIGSDRTFILYDIRTSKAERRVVMQVHRSVSLVSSASHVDLR